jgi:glycosyltransferase involved in cell wall biosynthesis
LRPLIDGHRIIYLGFLDDADLRQYIRRALAVVFVSRYEGFGFPAVESYMLNDTVIASTGNSVGEISRDFAFLVDETSVDAVADAMRAVLSGTQPHPRLSRDEICAKYTWGETARQLFVVFQGSVRSV